MKTLVGVAMVLVLLGAGEPSPDFYRGTWTGTSICVGNNPACKDEIVVYRFVPMADHPGQIRLLGDKVIDGKRVPMGALVFDHDEKSNALRCEFRIGKTHGVWSYALAGEDSLVGSLIVLPDGAKARDVKAHRVGNEKDVPPAPALKEYEE